MPKVAADALHLPFADGVFDAVTISFGLRNVADPDAALAELARVTRPGGRLVVCEFGTPTWAPFRAAYHGLMLGHVLPAIARRVSSQPGRLPLPRRSPSGTGRPSRSWPTGSRTPAGSDVAWRDLTGGAVALHRATRPA